MYGIAFVTLGNLSGNAIAFGIYVMNAAGQTDPDRGAVTGIAIAALTLAVLIHLFSRRGGIIINNCFAMLKVALLLVIFIVGMIKASGRNLGGAPETTYNFDPDNSFTTPRHDVASYSNSFLFIVYTYSGFEQPFYVLAEVRRPRRVFPKYTLLAMGIASVLFLLVNIAYFCAVPSDSLEVVERRNMAVVFFGQVFGAEVAKRVMSVAIAISIFGNILVMTFTASRVKQEIAKEGILPFSLVFATSHTTPLARWRNRNRVLAEGEYLDQTPMAALGLHWVTSVFLVAVTSGLKPAVAYSVLISLYSYTIIILIGFFTSAGLVYLHARSSLNWQPSFSPPGRWIYGAIYAVVCLFMLFASFVPPEPGSPWSSEATGVTWYLIPTIGLTVPLWGVIWYFGLRGVMAYRGKDLVIRRDPVTEPDGDEWKMISEHITQEWHVRSTFTREMEYRHID
jgi:amino acid transporter